MTQLRIKCPLAYLQVLPSLFYHCSPFYLLFCSLISNPDISLCLNACPQLIITVITCWKWRGHSDSFFSYASSITQRYKWKTVQKNWIQLIRRILAESMHLSLHSLRESHIVLYVTNWHLVLSVRTQRRTNDVRIVCTTVGKKGMCLGTKQHQTVKKSSSYPILCLAEVS